MTGEAVGVTTATGIVGAGSSLTVEQVQHYLTAPLAAQSVFLSSGVQIIDSAVPVRIPAAPDPDEDLAFVGEGETIPVVTPEFDDVTLLPSTMKSLKVIAKFTSEISRQSVVAVDAALQSNLVSSVAATLDKALIGNNGDGASTVKGLLHFAGVQTADKAAAALSVDDLYDFVELLTSAYVSEQDLVWWMPTKVLRDLRKLKATGTGNYLVQPDPTRSAGSTLLGIPVTTTNRIPTVAGVDPNPDTSSIVLWAPRYTVVARDLAPSVRFLTELYQGEDEIGVQVKARYDVGVTKPSSILRVDNVKVA